MIKTKNDEMIEIVTTIKEIPKSGILFEYESLNEKKEVINKIEKINF